MLGGLLWPHMMMIGVLGEASSNGPAFQLCSGWWILISQMESLVMIGEIEVPLVFAKSQSWLNWLHRWIPSILWFVMMTYGALNSSLCLKRCSSKILHRKRVISKGKKPETTEFDDVQTKPVGWTGELVNALGVSWMVFLVTYVVTNLGWYSPWMLCGDWWFPGPVFWLIDFHLG